MPDSKVDPLTLASALTGVENIYCSQGAADRRLTPNLLDVYISATLKTLTNKTLDAPFINDAVFGGSCIFGGSPVFPANVVLASKAAGYGMFKATQNNSATGQAITPLTWTKITNAVFNVEMVDRQGWYDAANAKYQPQVAGYYSLSSSVVLAGLDDQARAVMGIGKNGASPGASPTAECILCGRGAGSGVNIAGFSGSGHLYFNGSTDYAEVWIFHGSATNQNILVTSNQYNAFSGGLFNAD
jgi:hypothetical protein